MKTLVAFAAVAGLLTVGIPTSYAAAVQSNAQTQTNGSSAPLNVQNLPPNMTVNSVDVTANGIKRAITYTQVDFNDPHYQLLTTVANYTYLKSVDSLADMADSVHAVAAVNGGFFNSYSDDQPQGTIEINQNFLTCLGSTLMGITADNHLRFVPGSDKKITGTINGLSDAAHTFGAWGINYNYNNNPEQNVIFTPSYGSYTGLDDGRCVVVKQGKVAYFNTGNTYIPPDGFVIYFGPYLTLSSQFSVGDTVSYQVQPVDQNKNPVDWGNVQNALSAGPMLVQNGHVVVNPEGEGLTDPAVTTETCMRSFIGVTQDNKLVMGTVPKVTVQQLAPLLQKFGLYNAMGLDSGDSSGLYVNGKYLTKPNRWLNSSLALVYNQEPAPRIQLNGKFMMFEHPPVMQNSRTLVPARNLFNQLSASVNWDATNQSISIEGTGTTIQLQIGEKTAKVNGNNVTLDVPPQIINDSTYIPLRFVAESLGKHVTWDNNIYAVNLN